MVFEVFRASYIDIVVFHFMAPSCLACGYQTVWYCNTEDSNMDSEHLNQKLWFVVTR
jgi:hypothetical protein